MNLDIRYYTDTLHANLKILEIKDMYEVNIIAFVNKCISKDCPQIFHDYYVRQPHRFQGYNQKLVVPRVRIDVGELSVKVKGAWLWNKLNKNLKNKAHFKSFKNILTKHYVKRYN